METSDALKEIYGTKLVVKPLAGDYTSALESYR